MSNIIHVSHSGKTEVSVDLGNSTLKLIITDNDIKGKAPNVSVDNKPKPTTKNKPQASKVEYEFFATREELEEFLAKADVVPRIKLKRTIKDLSYLFDKPIFHKKPKEFFLNVRYWNLAYVDNLDGFFKGCANVDMNLSKLRIRGGVSLNEFEEGTNLSVENVQKLIDKSCRVATHVASMKAKRDAQMKSNMGEEDNTDTTSGTN